MKASEAESGALRANRAGYWLALLAVLTPLVVGLLLSWHSLSDADIWLHNRIGRQILSGQGVPANGDFTFTDPDHPWTNHETLWQVLIAPLGPGGPPASVQTDPEVDPRGWNLLRLALTGLILLLLATGDGRRRQVLTVGAPGFGAAWWGLPLLAGLGLLWPRLILRPELISYVFFILAVRRVEQSLLRTGPNPKGIGDDRRWQRWLHPGQPSGSIFWLTLVWAWCHGFAVLAPVLWILGGLLALLERRIRSFGGPVPATTLRDWAVVLGLSLAALALTPSGLEGLVFPLRALSQFSRESIDMTHVISELAPLLETRNSLHWTLWLFRASLVWSGLFALATWGRISLLRILLVAVTAAAAIASQRNLGLYAVAFCLLHSGLAAAPAGRGFAIGPLRRIADRWLSLPRLPLAIAGLTVTLILGIGWSLLIVSDGFYLREGVGRRFGSGLTPAQYALESVEQVRRAGAGRLFSNLSGAALLLDRSAAKLFIDGRTEAHQASRWIQYDRIRRGGSQAVSALESMNAEGVLIGGGGMAFRTLAADLVAEDRWRLTWVEEAGLLFTPAPARHRAAADTLTLAREADRLEGVLLGLEQELASARFADRCLALARLWKMAGRPDRQMAILQRALQLRPDHPTLQHNLGNVLLEQGRFTRARTAFAAALATNPRLAGSSLNLGACLMSEKRPAEAVDAFRRAVRIDPTLFEAWANLGMALEQTGRPGEALEALQRALELRPNDERLRRYLASKRR